MLKHVFQRRHSAVLIWVPQSGESKEAGFLLDQLVLPIKVRGSKESRAYEAIEPIAEACRQNRPWNRRLMRWNVTV